MTLPCRSRSNPSLSANERRKLGIGSHQEIDLANIRSDQRPMFADFVAARGHERIGREEAGAIQMTTLHPIRVLMILDTFRFGGAENLVAELGRFDPESLQVAVASLAPAEIAGDAMFGRLAAAGLKPTYLSVRRLLDLRGFFRLVRTLRLVPVDVVHTHLDYSAMLVPLAARLAGKPTVATLHETPRQHPSRRERLKELLTVRVPGRLGRVVFVSQYAFDEFARRYGPARSTWRVIHNGINLDRYNPQRDRPPGSERPVWAVVAALRPLKNHVDLVRAWAGVVAVHPKATLLVVGDGPSRSDIEQTLADAGLQDSVRMLGRREDVPELLQTVDGVVSASVWEALPTALIEAGACGLPVVAADAGGTGEIVEDGVNGRLVPVRDVPALTRALLDIIGDPALAADYGAAGRARAEEKFSMTTWVNALERLYREVIGGA